eukprot:COSAG02_NODE_31765_length_528_cov_2.091121_1_plen_65_part_01
MNSSTPPRTQPLQRNILQLIDSLRFANRMYYTVSLSKYIQLTVYFTNYGSGSPFTPQDSTPPEKH